MQLCAAQNTDNDKNDYLLVYALTFYCYFRVYSLKLHRNLCCKAVCHVVPAAASRLKFTVANALDALEVVRALDIR